MLQEGIDAIALQEIPEAMAKRLKATLGELTRQLWVPRRESVVFIPADNCRPLLELRLR
jgi:hypothetical protein